MSIHEEVNFPPWFDRGLARSALRHLHDADETIRLLTEVISSSMEQERRPPAGDSLPETGDHRGATRRRDPPNPAQAGARDLFLPRVPPRDPGASCYHLRVARIICFARSSACHIPP